MSDTNFYQVLGVERSASANKIKSAYRELVKQHHPDVFATARDKAKATEKMRQLNEAYAVLGNAERRRRYDRESIQQSRPVPRAPVAGQHRRAARPVRPVSLRTQWADILKKLPRFSRKRAGYALAAAAGIMLFIYAARSVPILVTAWILVEKVEFSPAKSISPPRDAGEGWVRLGEYASVSECSGIVKEKVLKDTQEGSEAVFDERNATLAVTVYVNDRDTGKSNWNPESSNRLQAGAESFSAGITKRVRYLECRETRRLEMEPWFQRPLRGLGLLQ
jgi:hypothetical protein